MHAVKHLFIFFLSAFKLLPESLVAISAGEHLLVVEFDELKLPLGVIELLDLVVKDAILIL